MAQHNSNKEGTKNEYNVAADPTLGTHDDLTRKEELFQRPCAENTLPRFVAGTAEWALDGSRIIITMISRDFLPLNPGSMHH
ncbi:hypothetical protein DKX38_008393 [Salix brachista]|uniref:Uncharacterized protein n=1 Tax=Salix brachista TaxID=2182728 RepID=A0A5N5MQW0_9ROSI|nr:hypothetical protein DKX38_008393 [Salix brachista]